MNRKSSMEHFSITVVALIAIVCLVSPLFEAVYAAPPEPTPSPATDVATSLQPHQTPGIAAARPDGRLFRVSPLSSKVQEPPIDTQAQQTLYAIADAVVLQGYPSQNFGYTSDMWAGYDEYLEPDGQVARSLIKFSIASLPPNINITQATLKVNLVGSWDYPNTSRIIQTYRISSSWAESSVTWNNKPGYGGAYGSTPILSSAWGWYEFDVTGLVKAWYAGTYPDYGIMLRGPEVSGANASWRAFGTRESPYVPQLDIEYISEEVLDWYVYLPVVLRNWEAPPSPPTSEPPPYTDWPCLYAVNWWRDGSGNLRWSVYEPACLMAQNPGFQREYDSVGRFIRYTASLVRPTKWDFDMVADYIFNASGGVEGADVVKTYTGGYQYQMKITKFCPQVGDLLGYKVKVDAPPYNGQEIVVGICN